MVSRNKALEMINSLLEKDNIPLISFNSLDTVVLDTSRVLDKEVVINLNKIKNDFDINLNSSQRQSIRRYLIGYPDSEDKYAHYKLIPSDDELITAYDYISNGIKHNKEAVLNTIISRYKLYFLHMSNNVDSKYMEYIKELQKNKYQLIYMNINASDHFNSEDINHFVKNSYDHLSNYHNFVINFRNTNNEEVNWNTIAKVAIYMENFLIEKGFNVFQKRNRLNRIKDMNDFLSKNCNINNTNNLKNVVNKFYQGVSYGFRFVDLFISNDGNVKSLVMQKVQLDESPKRCPSCFNLTFRGNSYPKLLFKSFECQNPYCPSRSKSGRGKRFDLFSAKSQLMLRRNNDDDKISNRIYENVHRDIVNREMLNINTMIQLYTWSGDHVLCVNNKSYKTVYKGRSINFTSLNRSKDNNLFNNLLIVRLLNEVYLNVDIFSYPNDELTKINKNTLLINDNSLNIQNYQKNLNINIGAAITSPPYYNAREYSQWHNFLCYLIDMMINAKAVYNSLDNNSAYIYNVGDIVDKDYVYIKSHMSQCRLMLGFYSSLIFNIVGFKLVNNIIWDKGEVQSKRNSSPNHFSGYIKPINSYEHNLVFYKGDFKENEALLKDRVLSIPPVKKINSKGKNVYGHTAPFPESIASLIIPFASKNKYILDPFVGSGTTNIVANNSKYKSIGFELNSNYYNLAINRINEDQLKLF